MQINYIIFMAFDGSVVRAVTDELNRKLLNGRVFKIAQTEKEELLITIKNEGEQYRLLICANPSLPIIYLTDASKTAPLNAPAFCMLLRKHLQNGRITAIRQPSMERIIEFDVEHFDEMGDLVSKTLTVELMGRHSNIIFRDGDRILDSIRHVGASVSSVREVLPGRTYFIPFEKDKLNPFETARDDFFGKVFNGSAESLAKSLYTSVTGFSPMLAQETAFRAGVDSDRAVSSFNAMEQLKVAEAFEDIVSIIASGRFCPNIVYENGEPVNYGIFEFRSCPGDVKNYDSISKLLSDFYSQKQSVTAVRQKTADLRQIVQTILNRDYKKYDLQLKQLKDTEKKDKFKVYGELLTAYGYSVPAKSTSFVTENFYDGNEITIPLDPTISAVENGKKYFEKYSKLRRTADALSGIISETKEEIDHLESVSASLDTVKDEADIAEVKSELTEFGYIKGKTGNSGLGRSSAGKAAGWKNPNGKQKKSNTPGKGEKAIKSSPLHYVSSDGFDIFVGKNNYQNEYVSFKLASGNDWWFHAKGIPGSHVIIRGNGLEIPDRTFEEAGRLAAHYSKGSAAGKAEVDYTQRKNLKKPAGAKPGFVIYHTNFSMSASTDITGIAEA